MRNIIIVDDDNDITTIVRLIFKNNKDINLIEVNDPLVFMEYDLDTIDLVILDYMMPKLTGADLVKVIRDTYSLKELPILMLTVKQDDKTKIEALKCGVNVYMTKPFIPTNLKRVVENFLYRNIK